MDVELEAEGDCQEDEHLQEVVPRSKGLQSGKNLKDQSKECNLSHQFITKSESSTGKELLVSR